MMIEIKQKATNSCRPNHFSVLSASDDNYVMIIFLWLGTFIKGISSYIIRYFVMEVFALPYLRCVANKKINWINTHCVVIIAY